MTVVSGPSGVGKGTVIRRLAERLPGVWVSVSATTRPARPGEQDGRDYLFVSEPAFEAIAAAGGFLEHASYAGYRYGTPRGPVEERLAAGVPVVVEIDVQGARQVRRAVPTARLVFIAPPSTAELERRLAGRGTEDDERLARRLALARAELDAQAEFDHVVVNDDVEAAVAALLPLVSP